MFPSKPHILFGIALASAVLVSAVTSAVSAAPSFDCETARNLAERTVCRTEGLARVDRHLSLYYKRLMEELGFFGRVKLRRDERAFLAVRDSCGADVTCLRVTYRGQVHELRHRLEKLGIRIDGE